MALTDERRSALRPARKLRYSPEAFTRRRRIRRWVAEHVAATPPAAIVLTHAHFDHVGAIEQLLDAWDVPVYAHALELPYVTGRESYPPPDPSVGGGMMARMSVVYPRGPIDVRPHARELSSDGSLPAMPDWRWIHVAVPASARADAFNPRSRSAP